MADVLKVLTNIGGMDHFDASFGSDAPTRRASNVFMFNTAGAQSTPEVFGAPVRTNEM